MTPRGRSSPPTSCARRSRRWATTTPRSRRRRWPTRSRRPTPPATWCARCRGRGCGPCRRRRCSAARRSSGRWRCPTTCWPRPPTTPGSSSGWAGASRSCGSRRATSRSRRRLRPRDRGARPVLTELPRPPAPGRPGRPGDVRRAGLHGRERRALPDRGQRARDRGARRLRAHLPLLRRPGRLAAPVLALAGGRRPRRLLRVRARRDRPAAGDRGRLRGRARRTAWPSLLDGYEWDYVVGSVHFIRDGAVDHEDFDVWDSARDPDQVWRRYFEIAGRGGAQRHVRHPRPPRPGQDVGAATARGPTATCAGTTTWRWRGSRSRASRSRCPPRGCASRWASSTRRGRSWRWCSTPATRSRCPRDAHAPDHLGAGYEQAVELLGDLGVGELAVFEGRERRMEPLG